MAKKVYSFRLEAEAKLALGIRAKDGNCSEGEIIERLLAQGSSTAERHAHNVDAAGSIPAPASNVIRPDSGLVLPKGSLNKDDLKEMLRNGGRIVGATQATEESNGMTFPFKVQKGDDVLTIWRKGSKFGWENEEAGCGNFITEKQAQEFWEKRIP